MRKSEKERVKGKKRENGSYGARDYTDEASKGGKGRDERREGE